MNGASDLAVALFGDAGRHARTTVRRAVAAARYFGRGRRAVPHCLNAARAYTEGMPDGTAALSLTLHKSIAEIPAAAWDACAGADNPFVSHAFLAALEESG